MKRSINNFLYTLEGLAIAVLTVCISILTVVNIKFIYTYCIYKFDLINAVNMSKYEIMSDYNKIIHYLQNPLSRKLEFDNFIMSESGRAHFLDVKKIVMSIYIITITILAVLLIAYILRKERLNQYEITKSLNSGANSLLILFTTLSLVALTDFSNAFVKFHELFFKNEDWLFDSSTDTIINVLPEDVFKVYVFAAISIILIATITFKIIHYKKNVKVKFAIH